MKTCSKCSVEKTLAAFSRDKTKADGYHHQCKECRFAATKLREQRVWAPILSKICNECKIDKPASSFNSHKRMRDGLAHRCRECANSYLRKYFRDRPGKMLRYNRQRKASKINAVMRHWDPELYDLADVEAEDVRRRREALTGIKWHLDHVIALRAKNACGVHFPTNWAVIPWRDNLSKGNR